MTKVNKIFPGRRGYKGPNVGIFFLLHHEELAETSSNVKERVHYVKVTKDDNEIKTRLRSMVYIDPKYFPVRIQRALAKWKKLVIAEKKAVEDEYKAWQKMVPGKPSAVFQHASKVAEKAEKDRDESKVVLDGLVRDWSFTDKARQLLNELLPDNTWDGLRIVFPVK